MDDKNNTQPQAQPSVPVTPDFTNTPQATPAPEQPPVATEPMAGFATTPPAQPNQQPAPVVAPGQSMPSVAPKPKMKKGLLAIIIAAAAVLVLGGGSALAYNLWYQNSQKVVTDGIVNMISAKSLTYTAMLTTDPESGDTTEIKLDGAVNGAAGMANATIKTQAEGKQITVTGSGVFDAKGDLYVKVGNITEIVDEYKSTLPYTMLDTVDKIVKKIDNQWIKISADDLKSVSDEAATVQTCVSKAIEDFSSDKKANKEIGDLYAKNQFIKIDKKLGSKNGSLGYALKADGSKTKAFLKGLKDTKLYKDINSCDSSFTIDEDDLGDVTNKETNDDVIVEMWVSRWSHQITNITIKGGPDAKGSDKATLVFEPKVGAKATIETPKSSTTVSDLSKDIENLINDFSNPYGSLDYDYSDDYKYDTQYDY